MAGKRPAAIEIGADNRLVFTAHFSDNTLSQPQNFACDEAHQFRAHPGNKYAYAACRKDTLRQFTPDAGAGTATPIEPAQITIAGGPRHLDFHPAGDTLYLLLELSSEVAVFDINPQTGALINPPRQVIATTRQFKKQKQRYSYHAGRKLGLRL